MAMLSKKKLLTFGEKYKLLEEVKSGVSKQSILQKYGIKHRTYDAVLGRESDIRKKVISGEYMKKRSTRTSDAVLNAVMLVWFQQAIARGDPISGLIAREKALILNEKLNGPKSFTASAGWLSKFKNRNGIRLYIQRKPEKLSDDPVVAAEFSENFKAKIESENLNLDNIYNADETGILWQLLMACTLAQYKIKLEAAKRKNKYIARVTALFCANVTGSHRIPLLTIGKYSGPQWLINLKTRNLKDLQFKNLESLGVIYTYQSNAWMDTYIFTLWYKDVFIPRVLEHQRKSGITGKVVLILDNAPPHPSLDELNAVNENFEVVYLLPNVTTLIQPMEQGIIAIIKKLYKKNLLRLLLVSEKSEGAIEFLKKLNLRDCLDMLSRAWDDVKSSTLQKAWIPLLGESFLLNKVPGSTNIQDSLSNVNALDVSERESPTDLISFPYEICDQVSELLSGPDYSVERSREFVLKWFENNDQNETDCGWQPYQAVMTDIVIHGRSVPEITTNRKKRKKKKIG